MHKATKTSQPKRSIIMRVPFTLSDESVTLFALGKMHTIRSSHRNFDLVVEKLKEPVHSEEV